MHSGHTLVFWPGGFAWGTQNATQSSWLIGASGAISIQYSKPYYENKIVVRSTMGILEWSGVGEFSVGMYEHVHDL